LRFSSSQMFLWSQANCSHPNLLETLGPRSPAAGTERKGTHTIGNVTYFFFVWKAFSLAPLLPHVSFTWIFCLAKWVCALRRHIVFLKK
jgi:hypothetical protein